MRILVPLDGSSLAEYSINQAARLARALTPPADVELLRVVSLTPDALASHVPEYTNIVNLVVEACHDYLREIAMRPSLEDISVNKHVVVATNETGKVISMEARSLNVDMIMLASHGRTGLAKILLGSVAESIIQHADIPVLLLRVEDNEFSWQVHETPFRILVPLDGTPLSEEILPSVAAIARAFEARVRLLRILPNPTGDYDQAMLTGAQTYLTEIAAHLRRQGVETDLSYAIGEPAAEIIRVAQSTDQGSDMVAMVTHGRQGIDHLMHGSIATAVISALHQPLLIYHPVNTR